MAWELELSGTVLEDLYAWIDNIPLSRPKKKIERDFSDGTLAAEVVRHYLPDIISVKSYAPNSAISQKKINWGMLNRNVFGRLGLHLPESVINDLSNAKPGIIEIFLFNLKLKIDEELELRQKNQSQASSSPHQSLASSNNVVHTNDGKSPPSKRTSQINRSIGNLRDRWIPRLDYEELKQHCLQLQEELEIVQARIRRIEHLIQLKDFRIAQLTTIIDDYRRIKPTPLNTDKYLKK